MSEDKRLEEISGNAMETGEDKKKGGSSASRARNRTVMLTPEMTGQVRALLQDAAERGADEDHSGGSLDDFLPPLTDWDAGSGGSPGHHEGGLRSEHPGLFGLERNSGSFGHVEPEPAEFLGHHEEKNTGFDPLTSVVPPIQPQPRGGGYVAPIERESKPPQPSFSVNRAPAAANVGQGRAPRAPMQSVSGVGAVVSSAANRSRIVGFLVSFDNDQSGDVFEIRAGRWLVTSRPTDHGDYVLINDETISPLHAILRATKEGNVQVLDQLSEYGTGILRGGQGEELEVSGGLENLSHGDVVRFGKRKFVVCCIPKVDLGTDEGK